VEIAVRDRAAEITLGPVLFNWQPDQWRDFYFRIADEAPVATVYLGEVICSKRAPLFEPHCEAVAERLRAAGKTVVFSTLSEVTQNIDRKLVESISSTQECLVEANDSSALLQLQGRPHHIGPFMNVYNERSVALLARGGARNFCLPAEMPAATIRALCRETQNLDATFEVLVFGRMPLALSARCYHARAHGRTKDSCLFVCENDPDGLELRTLSGQPFLAVNGIQTLSHDFLNLIDRLDELRSMGVSRFRLSPHRCDMVRVATAFRGLLDGTLAATEAAAALTGLKLPGPFSNGFYDGKVGLSRSNAADQRRQ
jgi:O2-independent ubiquinone biosynthesis protein UbiV